MWKPHTAHRKLYILLYYSPCYSQLHYHALCLFEVKLIVLVDIGEGRLEANELHNIASGTSHVESSLCE